MTSLPAGFLAAILAIVLNLLIVARIRRALPWDQSRPLIRVYLATLVMRSALAIILNVFATSADFAAYFWGDSSTYDYRGSVLAMQWSGEVLIDPFEERWVSGWGFNNFVGAIYFLFGQNQLLVQFINVTLGSLTVVVVYSIASHLFGHDEAVWSARFMAYFPQMVFWSAGMYKDTSVMLCIGLCILAALRLNERFSFLWLAVFVLSALALMTLRFYVFYIIVFATFGTFLFTQRRGLLGSIVAQAAFAAAFFVAFSFAASKETVERQTAYFDLQRVQVARLDQTQSAESGFAEGDVSTVTGAASAIPRGLLYLLFAPFPWQVTNLRQALAVPETLVWYALMPSMLRGVRHVLRHKLRQSLPILAFTIALTLAYAVFQGNVGTAYRQRTQITMFFFIFIGVGLVLKSKSRMALAARAAAPVVRRTH